MTKNREFIWYAVIALLIVWSIMFGVWFVMKHEPYIVFGQKDEPPIIGLKFKAEDNHEYSD